MNIKFTVGIYSKLIQNFWNIINFKGPIFQKTKLYFYLNRNKFLPFKGWYFSLFYHFIYLYTRLRMILLCKIEKDEKTIWGGKKS